MIRKIVASCWPWLSSCVLLSLAFPPLNFWPLIFVAMVPWLWQLKIGDGKAGFWSGYGFGFVYFAFQMFWIVPFVQRWTGDLGLALLPWVVTAFLAGWFYALVGWLVSVCYGRGWLWLIPLVWAGIEGFRAYIPGLAFPWGNLGLPLWQVPALAQIGAFGTMFLVSAWVMLVNLVIQQFFARRESEAGSRFRRFGVVVAVLFGAVSVARFMSSPAGVDRVFSLGQPGVNMAFSSPEEERALLADVSGEMLTAAEKANSDLLILPEGYAGQVMGELPYTPMGLRPAVSIIMGGQRLDGTDGAFQTAYAWDGVEWSHADKTRLVVFGEYVPLRDQLPFLNNFDLPAGDLKAADEFQTLQIGEMKVGQLICFEGVFPDLVVRHSENGAQVLVQMSIDDWYENTLAHDQLWMSSVWRSIESGLPLMRVGARGRSLATDSRGRIVDSIPVGRTEARSVKVKVPARSDAFGGRFWFVYLTWLACAGVGAVGVRRRAGAGEV